MAPRGGVSRIRFRFLPTVLMTVAILLLPALLYAWGRQADAFAIERITVSGGRRVPEKQALKLLRREFLGHNLFTVTTGDVGAALGSLCYVAGVEVDRDFPTTLRVRLVEHRPAAYVLAKGRWFVVADSGHVVCEVEAAPAPTPTPTASPADGEEAEDAPAAQEPDVAATLAKGPPAMKPVLPRLATATVPKPGEQIADDQVRRALRVVTGMPDSLRARVQVLRVRPTGEVSLDLQDGPRVEFGGDERLVAKVLALRAVLAAYRRGDMTPTYIDVSAPDRPLARPRLTS